MQYPNILHMLMVLVFVLIWVKTFLRCTLYILHLSGLNQKLLCVPILMRQGSHNPCKSSQFSQQVQSFDQSTGASVKQGSYQTDNKVITRFVCQGVPP